MRLGFVDRRHVRHLDVFRTVQPLHCKADMIEPFTEIRAKSKKRPMFLPRQPIQKFVSGSSKLIPCIQIFR